MSRIQPWTFVVSEYLDLPFMLRRAGEAVVSARSVPEAMGCLRYWCPARVLVDLECYDAVALAAYVRERCPGTVLELQEGLPERLLAAG